MSGCTDFGACNYDASATVDDGSCDYGTMCADGSYACDANDCPSEVSDNMLWFEAGSNDGDIDVWMLNFEPVAGFQYNVSGASVINTSGGTAASNGFLISASSITVIGFSLQGATIPVGEDVLLEMAVSFNASEACPSNIVISDEVGIPMETITGSCVQQP